MLTKKKLKNEIKYSKRKISKYLNKSSKSKNRNLSKFLNEQTLNLIDDDSIKSLETFVVTGMLNLVFNY